MQYYALYFAEINIVAYDITIHFKSKSSSQLKYLLFE